ncbi:MAG: T9SS type A sorting domain-containing protein [Bacteroidetes bacterium]|nr:T9SS type A sorting domain-containing protein [Bacteroidota bacterium]
MKKIYIFFLFIVLNHFAKAQYVKFWIIEPKSGVFALVNFYTTTQDFSNYRVSVDGGVDTPLKALTIFIGNINVKGRETVAFSGLPLGKTDGSISLYLPGDTVNHVRGQLYDYCQWGSGGHQNEDSADYLKLWKKGTFVSATPPFSFKCDEWNFGVQCWQGGKLPIVIMRFAYVSPWSNTFCIKNAGVSNIDMSYSTICINGTCYDSLKNAPVEIVKGKIDIAKNDSLVLRVTTQKLDTVNGSLALFALPNQLTDTTGLLDFVQWGQGNQAYAGLAHKKGIWDSLQFVQILRSKDSLRYNGDYTRNQVGKNYWESDSAYIAPNIGVLYTTPINYQCFPNPTSGKVTIISNELSRLKIYDMQGKQFKDVQISGTTSEIDFIAFPAGIYTVELINKTSQSTYQKLMKMD